MKPPVLWGDEATVRERFGEGISDLKLTRRLTDMKFPFGPAEVVEHFRTYFGPTVKAFGTLDAEHQEALRAELEQLFADNNQATDGTTRVQGEYLEVIAVKA
jgi:hypothetical protein